MHKVNSSNVAELGYDSATQVLYVLFHNGYLYKYYDVPEYEYKQLDSASSIGKYLNENIVKRYRYERIK